MSLLNQYYLQNTMTANATNFTQWAMLNQAIQSYQPPVGLLPSKPSVLTNVDWLRKRVDELRVRL